MNTLIGILLVTSLLILVGFSFFAAFHFCDDDIPSKIFLISLGVIALVVTVVVAIAFMKV